MVELFDADLKRKGFDGVALPAGSYELHKINGVRLDINKSLDELGVQDGDTLVLVPRVAGESFEPQYESLSTGLAAMGKWLGRDGGDRMFAPVTSLTAAHTAMAIIAMAVGVVLALTLRTRTITDSPVPAAMAGGIGVLLVIGALVRGCPAVCGMPSMHHLHPVRGLYRLRALHRLCGVFVVRELFGTAECGRRPKSSGWQPGPGFELTATF